jgi:hypothetical protein
MSGPSNAQTDIVWPGYVAAMASLLLSLLLVAAVLVVTISQIGSVSESYQQAIANIGFKSTQQVESMARVAGIFEGTSDRDSEGSEINPDQSGQLGKVNASSKVKMDPSKARVISEESKGAAGQDKKPILDFANANFDRDSARQAAMLTANDKALLAQIDLSKVDVSKIKFTNIDISKIDLSKNISAEDFKKIDFSAVNFGTVIQGRIEALKPFIAKEGIRYQMALQKRQFEAKRQDKVAEVKPLVAAPAPAPVLAPAPAAVVAPAVTGDRSNALRINYLEDAIDALPAQKQSIVQSLSALNRQDNKLRVWVNLPSDDVYLKRIAYSRLMAVRAMAIEAGFPPGRVSVSIETVAGLAPLVREMTFHVAEVKP